MQKESINFAMKQSAHRLLRMFLWISTLTVAALFVPSMVHAEEAGSSCQTGLTAIDPYTEVIRVLWFPKSEFRWVSHTAIEVEGQVWTKIRKISKKPSFETYVRNANINTGFLSISIRVTSREINDLKQYLEENDGTNPDGRKILRNPYYIHTCSNGVFRLLTERRIINSPVGPTTLPYVMVAKFALEKVYRNPRIAGLEWVGRKPDKLLPYVRGSVVETAMISAYLALLSIPLHGQKEPVLTAMRDISRWATALFH